MNIYCGLPWGVQDLIRDKLDRHIYEKLHKPIQDDCYLELKRTIYYRNKENIFLMQAVNHNIIRYTRGLAGFAYSN